MEGGGGGFIWGGHLFNFSQIMAWHDDLFITSSAHEQAMRTVLVYRAVTKYVTLKNTVENKI